MFFKPLIDEIRISLRMYIYFGIYSLFGQLQLSIRAKYLFLLSLTSIDLRPQCYAYAHELAPKYSHLTLS